MEIQQQGQGPARTGGPARPASTQVTCEHLRSRALNRSAQYDACAQVMSAFDKSFSPSYISQKFAHTSLVQIFKQDDLGKRWLDAAIKRVTC